MVRKAHVLLVPTAECPRLMPAATYDRLSVSVRCGGLRFKRLSTLSTLPNKEFLRVFTAIPVNATYGEGWSKEIVAEALASTSIGRQ